MRTLMGHTNWYRVVGAILVLTTAVLFYGSVLLCIIWGVREICKVLL